LGESIFVQASDDVTYSWRLWRFIESSKTCDPPQNREQIRQAAKAFGAYQRAMAGLEAKRLVETIPGFLSMTGYLRQFDQVLATATQTERAEAMPWIAVVQSHRQWPSALMQPNAVIHGDCKVNNLLFDAQGERVLSVIDLDNNMNGHWAWDFGDLVRSVAFSRGGVDAADYRACVQGFLSGRGSVPLGNEHLIAAPSYLAFMLGLRFLTDHLSGDRYFSVPQHGENLQRAKEQFALFQSFERSRASMERIVSECT
jgi:Ser/Thr protein kinase RdoA (MazF antagonist)